MSGNNVLTLKLNGDSGFSTTEKLVSTKEFAKQLGTRPNVITENAKKCLPNKIIENGKPTYWNKAEVAILLDFMKSNNNRTDLDLTDRLIGTSTELTPALKIKKAFDLMQEGYEEELAILRAKNAEQEQKLAEQAPKVEFYDAVTDSTDCISMNDAAKVLGLPYGNITLFKKLREKGILDQRNIPYQEYLNRGYFRVIETEFKDQYGNSHVRQTTKVYQKGLDYIRKAVA